MIVQLTDWEKDYERYASCTPDADIKVQDFIDTLAQVLTELPTANIAYSGGIDSSIILHMLTEIKGKCNTFIMACREDHPDVLYAREGSKRYGSDHTEFIISGSGAYKTFFGCLSVDNIVCGDGIDEFMCGYYKHQQRASAYELLLGELLHSHLIPLNTESGNIGVYLPYLNNSVIDIMAAIPLSKKVSSTCRKIFVVKVAEHLGIPCGIINRNKYAFPDAFLLHDKEVLV